MSSTNSSKPRVKLDFLNTGFNKQNNLFYNLLAPHYDIQLTDKADFVIFNHSGHKHRLVNSVRIYWSQEPYPVNLNDCDYAITTFFPQSDREYRLPFYVTVTDAKDLVRKPETDYEEILRRKREFCCFMNGYVNRKTRNRVEFFQLLSKRYKQVDSGGKLLNNIGGPIPMGLENKRRWMTDYKFHIAFENKDTPGWVTEKFTDPLLVNTVPIYWGTKTIDVDFNKDAFIDANDFDSFEELADYVSEVDQDDALYLKYLSAPPFKNNTPNEAFDLSKLLAFFERIFTTPIDPVAHRRWKYRFNRWRLVKHDPYEPVHFLE